MGAALYGVHRAGSPVACRPMRYPGQHPRRATVVGAGSFGTAVALLLSRAGLRTTLLCRTPEQADRIASERENSAYLSGVELPSQLKIRTLGARSDQFD